jgi:hypothetical protein
MVTKVPVGNAENYRMERLQPADFAKFPVRSETAIIPAEIARPCPLKNRFINAIFLGKF